MLDCKTVGFFLKISKSLAREPHTPPVSLSVFSLVPDLLFDCSRVLEYAKIRTVLQSTPMWAMCLTVNCALGPLYLVSCGTKPSC